MTPLYFASRTNWNFSPNAIARKLDRLQEAGVRFLDLTESNPTACGINVSAGVLAPLAHARNRLYKPSALGDLKAREALAKYFRRQRVYVSPENIVLTASTSEAYSFAMRLLVNPGENVLFPSPSYPLLDHLAQLNDVEMRRYVLRYEGAWVLDWDSLRQAVTSKTRALVFVNPNNPTGSFLKREEAQALKTFCKEHSLALISDEVFADYAWRPDKNRIVTLAGKSEVLTFALGGVSKMLGLPQMKLSWICVGGPAAAKNHALQRLEMIGDTYLSVNTPAQNALPQWMAKREAMQKNICDRIATNRRTLESLAWKESGCDLLRAEGGWYAILRLPATRSEEEWALVILEKAHVLVHPGYFFDFDREAYLVLSLLPESAKFRIACKRMLSVISDG